MTRQGNGAVDMPDIVGSVTLKTSPSTSTTLRAQRGQIASAHARLEKLPSLCPALTFVVHDLLLPLALGMLLPRLQ